MLERVRSVDNINTTGAMIKEKVVLYISIKAGQVSQLGKRASEFTCMPKLWQKFGIAVKVGEQEVCQSGDAGTWNTR